MKIFKFPFIKTAILAIIIGISCFLPRIEFEPISLASNKVTSNAENKFLQGIEDAVLMHANAWKAQPKEIAKRVIDFPLMRKDPLNNPFCLYAFLLFIAVITWEETMWKSKKDMKKTNTKYWF